MIIKITPQGFDLSLMDADDLKSLRTMIKGASLPERQHWNDILEEVDAALNEEKP